MCLRRAQARGGSQPERAMPPTPRAWTRRRPASGLGFLMFRLRRVVWGSCGSVPSPGLQGRMRVNWTSERAQRPPRGPEGLQALCCGFMTSGEGGVGGHGVPQMQPASEVVVGGRKGASSPAQGGATLLPGIALREGTPTGRKPVPPLPGAVGPAGGSVRTGSPLPSVALPS